MGLFDKLLGKSSHADDLVIYAPMDGEAVPVSQVNDPTFSEEILGKGIAIRPTGTQVVAPCDATVEMMFDTGHAVSLQADNGAEVLIHVGHREPEGCPLHRSRRQRRQGEEGSAAYHL